MKLREDELLTKQNAIKTQMIRKLDIKPLKNAYKVSDSTTTKKHKICLYSVSRNMNVF